MVSFKETSTRHKEGYGNRSREKTIGFPCRVSRAEKLVEEGIVEEQRQHPACSGTLKIMGLPSHHAAQVDEVKFSTLFSRFSILLLPRCLFTDQSHTDAARELAREDTAGRVHIYESTGRAGDWLASRKDQLLLLLRPWLEPSKFSRFSLLGSFIVTQTLRRRRLDGSSGNLSCSVLVAHSCTNKFRVTRGYRSWTRWSTRPPRRRRLRR